MVSSAVGDNADVRSILLYEEMPSEAVKENSALEDQLSVLPIEGIRVNSYIPGKENVEKRLGMRYSVVDFAQVNNLSKLNAEQRKLSLDEPDQGYAWVILLCCTILQLIPNISITSAGLFYMEFVESSELDIQTASWMCSLQTSISYMFGPISALLVDTTSTRTVTLIGCLGSGVMLSIASFATDRTTLFVTYGVLPGVFFNCIYIPTVTYSANFFEKYKTLALSACTCFVPLVTVIFTPCITYFIETYNWRNSILFIAATCIQSAVLAALLRPARLKTIEETEDCNEVPQTTLNQLATSTFSIFSETKKTNNDVRSTVSLRSHYDHVCDLNSLTPIQSNLTPDIASQFLCEKVTPNDINDKQHVLERSEQTDCLSRCKMLRKCQPLIHWRVGALISSFFVHGWAASIFFILLPECASMQGLTTQQVSHLLMISGVAGFLCRIFFTLIVTTHLLLGYKIKGSKAMTAPMSLLVMSSAFIGVIFSTHYVHFAIASSVYIIGYAGITCYGGPVILEMHGESHLGILYGLEMFGYGLGSSIAPPMMAWLYVLAGSYTPGHIITCAGLAIGAIMYLPHIFSTCYKSGQETGTPA